MIPSSLVRQHRAEQRRGRARAGPLPAEVPQPPARAEARHHRAPPPPPAPAPPPAVPPHPPPLRSAHTPTSRLTPRRSLGPPRGGGAGGREAPGEVRESRRPLPERAARRAQARAVRRPVSHAHAAQHRLRPPGRSSAGAFPLRVRSRNPEAARPLPAANRQQVPRGHRVHRHGPPLARRLLRRLRALLRAARPRVGRAVRHAPRRLPHARRQGFPSLCAAPLTPARDSPASRRDDALLPPQGAQGGPAHAHAGAVPPCASSAPSARADHTNVLMAVGTGFAVVCLECIPDPGEREAVLEALKGKEASPPALWLAKTARGSHGGAR